MRYLIPALLLSLVPSAAFAQANAKVPDPNPELERKSFIVAPGFEVSLYAADPLLAKPIQMNFDPQGRLWVASSEIYPQIKPGEKANDKIIFLEDTNDDGKADRTTVFADGLLIPTGLEPGDGGVYVANSTELVHLSATKPGEKADRKRILLSGFGTEDTHHIIHTFRWGPDCRLYFNQSIYIHSHIETPRGVKRLNAGGIWRFNPDKTELDIFARGWINAWGHAFDRFGQSIVTDGAGGEGINHAIPGAYFMTSQGPHTQRILHGLNPGSPKYCGAEIVSGRHFPDDWQGDVITNDFRGHRVCRFKLSDDGSTFASREMTEVIKSTHPAFRPIDVKMGPDGALYIADWYNTIIQHGEVDFRDPRRDKTHGRIWRVTAKGRPLVPKPDLMNATVPELLDHLKAPEQWTRQQAKRVLKERGAEKVLPELEKWRAALPADALHARLEALWVQQSLDAIDPRLISNLEASTDGRVRAAVVRVVAQTDTSAPPRFTFTAGVNDPNPRVRLEAVRGLARVKSAVAAEIALAALDKPMDRVLDYALWLTVRELEPYWMPAFKDGKLTFGGDAKKLAFALNAIGNKDTVKPVLALIDSGKVPQENVHGLYLLLAQIGGPAEIGKVLLYAKSKQGKAEAEQSELVLAVEEAARLRKVGVPPGVESLLGMMGGNPATQQATFRLVGAWKVEKLRSSLHYWAGTDHDSGRGFRDAAFAGLISFGDAKAREFLVRSCAADVKPAEVRWLAIAALASLDSSAAAAKAAEFLPGAKPDDTLRDLFAAFASRKGGASLLAKALAGKKLDRDVAKIGVKAARASGQPADDLIAALTKAGDLAAARKPPTAEEVKTLVAEVAKADAARGELVYRRADMKCLACHAIGGAGGVVGPDMTSIGASAQPDYLVESLLIPSKAIKEGYHATRIVTADEKVLLGIKVREADGIFVLRTAEDKEISIPVKDIAERPQATTSLMPEGLTEQLTKQEFADLVAFLSQLGKIGGPYAPNKARLVRRWQAIDASGPNGNLFRRTRVSAAAEPDNPFTWSPAYSMVSGDLPLASLPKFTVWNDTAAQTVLRFNLDVTTPGAAKLKINSVAGLSLYLGATPVEPKAETVLDLKTGMLTVTLIIDRSKRTEDVRVELDDVAGSPARVSVVGGK